MKKYEFKMDRTVFWAGKKSEEPKDYLYWITQPYEKRLAALEYLNKSIFSFHYGREHIERGFQRVYTVIKRKKS